MSSGDWTVLSDKIFISELAAREFITILKLQMLTKCQQALEFKISIIHGKYYILYKML